MKFVLIIGWIVFLVLAYKASQIEIEHKEYDPFAIIGIDRTATEQEIKKKYRELTKTMHPDMGGDPAKYIELTKAVQALTDEATRKNWMEYGNPDGPGVTQFGIALPKWIVDGKNSYLVLGVYVLIFMIIMPLIVGTWWYRSIKYTGDQVLMLTSQLYGYLIMKSPQMNLKKIIMVLGSSAEFDRRSNPEIQERPSDNIEVPSLIREMPDLQDKIKEPPYSNPYSLKARALIHAHLNRLTVTSETLRKDQNLIIKKCPFLINEMINVACNFVQAANANYVPKNFHPPKLDTIESMMKLSPMIVQALMNKSKSNLLQLPHLEEGHLRHFVTKKRNISNIKQFVQTSDSDRRSILRHLTDEQYDDIMKVCAYYPHIEMDCKVKIIDDVDEHTVTCGALVTLVINLKRENLKVNFGNEEQGLSTSKQNEVSSLDDENKEENGDVSNLETNQKVAEAKPVHRPWEKQKKKSKFTKAKKKPNNKSKTNAKTKPVSNQVADAASNETSGKEANGNESEDDEELNEDQDDNLSGSENNSENEDENAKKIVDSTNKKENKKIETLKSNNNNSNNSPDSPDNEEYFEKFQKMQKKKEKLETKSKISQRVYCPYFPDIKQECWWLYVADRKSNNIICSPVYICTLKDTEEFEMKFLAPKRPAIYTYSVILRSDSFLDFDVIQNIKLDVLDVEPDKKVEKQWDFSDDEGAKNGDEEEQDDGFMTESESENE